jgi:glycosyltransferase involved in cell wall biosynthesis
LKILYLCPDLGVPILGSKGASAHVRGLVRALNTAGHSLVVAAPLLSKTAWQAPASLRAPVWHVPPGTGIRRAVAALRGFAVTLGADASFTGEVRRILYDHELLARLRRRFEQDRPDAIYERAALHATAGVALARELGIPHLLELNAPLSLEQTTYRGTGFGKLASEAERWTLTRTHAVLAVSGTLGQYALSLGVEPHRVHVLPNGVDEGLFQPGPPDRVTRARWALDTGPVLGFVGGLRPWHGVEALPLLLARIRARHPRVRLVVVGDGPLLAELVSSLRQAGLLEHVVFTGSLPQDEVAALIRQFDVALAPYAEVDHPFYFSPLKIFEYMACGIPPVAAGLGQIREVVRDGETGLLYPAGDDDAFAAACTRLLSDDDLRQRMGKAAAREVRGRYTWQRNAERVVEIARTLRASDDGRR